MASRNIEERNIRSLTKIASGGSYGITLPIEFIHKLGWRARQKLEVKLYKDCIIIRDWSEELLSCKNNTNSGKNVT